MSEASAEVIPFPASKEHLLAQALEDAQEELGHLRRQNVKLDRANQSLTTQLRNLKEANAEADSDADTVRELVVWHYARFQMRRQKARVPLTGVDATIVRWLLNAADFTPRDVALMSVGFAANDFYRSKGLTGFIHCATTKLDGKRVKDSEKAMRFRDAGVQLTGEKA